MGKLHTLSRSNVKSKAPKQVGVYKLYKTRNGPVRYVGSAKNLRQRLLDWANKNSYSYFEYEYADNRDKAYHREANLYHYYGESQLDNEQHPRRPNKRVKCPACEIHD